MRAAEAFRDLEAALVDFGHAFLEAWPGRALVWVCCRLAEFIEWRARGRRHE